MDLDLEVDFSLVLSVILVIFTCYMFGVFDSLLAMFQPKKDTRDVGPTFSKSFESRKEEQVERLSGPDCRILFGSQTGTAELFARKILAEGRQYTFNTKLEDMENFDHYELENLGFAIFVVATYGEGEPTDNARDFWDWISEAEVDLSNLKYTIFGLGNTTYEHYNWMARSLETRLQELGAQKVYEKGEGDDDSSLEDDFAKWKEGLWPALVDEFNIPKDQLNIRDSTLDRKWLYRVMQDEDSKLLANKKHMAASSGRGIIDLKNPYAATVRENKELHGKASDRSCRHLELEFGTAFHYEAGDHLGVYAENQPSIVDEAIRRLEVNPDEVFCLYEAPEGYDPEKTKIDYGKVTRVTPNPATVRQALTQFCEITGIPRKSVLKVFAAYASDPLEKEKLEQLSDTNPEPYNTFIKEESRSVLEVLHTFPSVKIPFSHFVEACPRLAPRYYSISSSPKEKPRHVTVTSVVVEFSTKTRQHKGVCSNWFLEQNPGKQIFCFPRKSTFKLPKSPETPIIMIGPGTGLAPFRGFLQERKNNFKLKSVKAETILFFGCRHPDQDYLYREELEEAQKEGYLSKLVVAFSREDPNKKVYVQNKMEEHKQEIFDLIVNKNAYIYICGDGKNMEKSVREALEQLISSLGNKTPEETNQYFATELKNRYQVDVW